MISSNSTSTCPQLIQSRRHFGQLLLKHLGLFPQPAYFVLFVLFCNKDLAMAMFNAFAAGLDTAQLTTQVEFQGAAHCTRRATYGLDAELLKGSDGPTPHPAGEHHVYALAVDETGHHPR
jgi:hypothetical protein